MDERTWWREHVRPRDVFIWGAVTSLLTLAGIVWVTRTAADRVETVLSLLFGAVTTLGGYYQGNRDADRASEREAGARKSLFALQQEIRLAHEKVAGTLAQLDAMTETSE